MSNNRSCPLCGKPLKPVRFPGGYLNREQWESVRAGDWYCDNCPSEVTKSGHSYFWESDFKEPTALSKTDPKNGFTAPQNYEDPTAVKIIAQLITERDNLKSLCEKMKGYVEHKPGCRFHDF